MTINYTTLLGLAKPVTGTETGQWGDVVNDEITSLLEDAVANAATFSVTVGDVTLSTTNGASNQARMSTLIITGSPGILRNVIVPSQAKIYVVINQANAEVVIKGAATTGVTVGAGQTAQIAWNGSDFVEIGNYVHGNFVVNGNLSVNGNSTLGDGGADTTTINGQFIGANSNISKATTVSTSAPALAWVKGATYTDTASSGGTTQAHAPFTLLSAPTLATSNIVTYTNASTFYIAGAPSASGSATITNPYAMYVAAGEAYLAGAVTMAATTQNLALGTSQTSGTWTAGGAAQTGALTLDQSTKTHTLNLGTGATESAATKTVNIGTAGVSGSTTAVNIGSAVSGATNNVTINGNPTFNSGTANGVLYLNGSKVATSGSALVFDGTNLGVGTANPAAFGLLAINGASASVNINATTGAAAFKLFEGAGTGRGSITSLNGSDGLAFLQGVTEGMRLTSTGLGIGTSSPASRLEVSGDIEQQNANYIRGKLAAGTRTRLFGLNSANILYVGGIDASQSETLFVRGGATQMMLDASGNLGLGVTPSGNYTLQTQVNFSTGFKGFSLGGVAGGTSQNGYPVVGYNVRLTNTIDSYQYNTSDWANVIAFKNGQFQFLNAVSGTAGNTISFTQAMTLDASGNLGVGVTNPSAYGKSAFVASAGATAFYAGSSTQGVYISNSTGTDVVYNSSGNATGAHVWQTGNTERARITSGGDFYVGATTAVFTNRKLQVDGGATPAGGFKCSASAQEVVTVWNSATTGDNKFVEWLTETSGVARGSITYNRGAGQVAYNITSDVRLKENIADADDAGGKVDALQVRQFDWKETGNHVDYGFVAQELEPIVPHAVSKPDAEDEMWSVDYSKLVPMLIKELQSLRARVAALEAA